MELSTSMPTPSANPDREMIFSVTPENMIDALCVLGATVLCFGASALKKKLDKKEGIIFLLVYGIYLAYIILRDL